MAASLVPVAMVANGDYELTLQSDGDKWSVL